MSKAQTVNALHTHLRVTLKYMLVLVQRLGVGCYLLIATSLFTYTLPACGQELDARVNINYSQIQGTSTSIFDNLKTTLEQFLNDRAWTSLQFTNTEKVNCTFNITVNKYIVANGAFETTLMVQATRPVYGSNYTTTLFLFNDPNFNFEFQEFDQIEFRADMVDNNLTATLAFYVYLILGLDMDAMAPLGGTELLQTAQTIVNNAQSLSYKGWKAFEDDKNRYAIINDMLDGGMEPFRKMQYAYYRDGLDVMSENVERGRAGITTAMELLKEANNNKSMSRLPQLFTEYKRDELLSIYKGHGTSNEKEAVVATLQKINPSQGPYWRQMKE